MDPDESGITSLFLLQRYYHHDKILVLRRKFGDVYFPFPSSRKRSTHTCMTILYLESCCDFDNELAEAVILAEGYDQVTICILYMYNVIFT